MKTSARSRQTALDTTFQPATLKSWKQISEFLGQPTAVAQRWVGEGMPVRKEGRYVTASPEELSRWLGKESGTTQSVHIATDTTDLSADLKRGLAELKGKRRKARLNRKR